MAAFIHKYLFWVYLILFTKSLIEDLIFSFGKISPIVPVHPNKTSFGLIFFG